METLKLKINKPVIEEKEIQLPHFRMNDCHAYKVFSSEECLQVCFGVKKVTLGICHAELAWNSNEQECTEAAFMEKYREVRNKLDEICEPHLKETQGESFPKD